MLYRSHYQADRSRWGSALRKSFELEGCVIAANEPAAGRMRVRLPRWDASFEDSLEVRWGTDEATYRFIYWDKFNLVMHVMVTVMAIFFESKNFALAALSMNLVVALVWLSSVLYARRTILERVRQRTMRRLTIAY